MTECFSSPTVFVLSTVSQIPSSVSYMAVNSSAEITCTTSLPNPMGLYLRRFFHSERDIVYLSLHKGKVTKNITAPNYGSRVHMGPDQPTEAEGSSFLLRLSLLQLDDTDLYYCSWSHFSKEKEKDETLASNGTVIIVTSKRTHTERDSPSIQNEKPWLTVVTLSSCAFTEAGPWEPCKDQILDLILISLSVTAFTLVLILSIGVLVVKCKRVSMKWTKSHQQNQQQNWNKCGSSLQFRRNFRPARDVEPLRPNSPQCICPERRPAPPCPYMTTSANPLDFRGILWAADASEENSTTVWLHTLILQRWPPISYLLFTSFCTNLYFVCGKVHEPPHPGRCGVYVARVLTKFLVVPCWVTCLCDLLAHTLCFLCVSLAASDLSVSWLTLIWTVNLSLR